MASPDTDFVLSLSLALQSAGLWSRGSVRQSLSCRWALESRQTGHLLPYGAVSRVKAQMAPLPRSRHPLTALQQHRAQMASAESLRLVRDASQIIVVKPSAFKSFPSPNLFFYIFFGLSVDYRFRSNELHYILINNQTDHLNLSIG